MKLEELPEAIMIHIMNFTAKGQYIRSTWWRSKSHSTTHIDKGTVSMGILRYRPVSKTFARLCLGCLRDIYFSRHRTEDNFGEKDATSTAISNDDSSGDNENDEEDDEEDDDDEITRKFSYDSGTSLYSDDTRDHVEPAVGIHILRLLLSQPQSLKTLNFLAFEVIGQEDFLLLEELITLLSRCEQLQKISIKLVLDQDFALYYAEMYYDYFPQSLYQEKKLRLDFLTSLLVDSLLSGSISSLREVNLDLSTEKISLEILPESPTFFDDSFYDNLLGCLPSLRRFTSSGVTIYPRDKLGLCVDSISSLYQNCYYHEDGRVR